MSDSILTVSEKAAYFAGHFPGHPIVPGAVILGWMLDRVREEAGHPDGPIRVIRVKFLEEIPPCAVLEISCCEVNQAWEVEVQWEGRPVSKALIRIP